MTFLTKSVITLTTRRYYKKVTKRKGDVIISKSFVKIIAALLTLLFATGTSICALAEDRSDAYGIMPSVTTSQYTPSFETASVIDNTLNDKNTVELKAEEVTPTGAVIRWSSRETYITYTLLKYNVLLGQYQEFLSTAETAVRLTDLNEDTEYRFALVSNGVNFLGELTFTTGVEKAAVSVAKVSSGSVELRITHSSKAAQLVLYRSTDGVHYTELGAAEGDSYVDTDVKEATSYYYQVKCVVTKGDKTAESQLSAPVKATTMKSYGLPAVSGETKTYAYYTAVTAKSSPQYKLLRSSDCYTDPETGIRMVDGRYCVALGSYYGTKIGTKYRITLEGGKELEVILCDQKSDRHTDTNHQYAVNNQDIVEFYIEKSKLPRGIRGNYGTLPQFSGKIIAIEKYIED